MKKSRLLLILTLSLVCLMAASGVAYSANDDGYVWTPVTGVSLNYNNLTLDTGDSFQLIETVYPRDADDQDVRWSSSNSSVASVSGNGFVTAANPGSATIIVTTDDGGYTDYCDITVSGSIMKNKVTGVSLDINSGVLNVGDSFTLNATVYPYDADNKAVSWSSSNNQIASVNYYGQVTAYSEGNVTITVTTEDGGYTDYCSLYVQGSSPNRGITLNRSSLSLSPNGTATLIATTYPSSYNPTIYWDSSNDNVASVYDGYVYANRTGTATITASTSDGYSASCQVTVSGSNYISVSGVSLNYTNNTLQVGDSLRLSANVKPSNATNQSVSWTSNDSSVASVDSNGKVSAKKSGTATITVSTDDGNYKATCKITVNNTVQVTGVTLNSDSMDLNIGDTYNLIATVRPAGAVNDNVTWSSSNASIAEVNSHGRVTAKKAGTCNITVATVEGNYSAVCHIYVSEGSKISVTGVNLNQVQMNLPVDQYATLEASVTPSNATIKSVDWTSSDSSIVSVDPTGKIIARANGTATITASTVDGDYKASCKVTVGSSNKKDLFSAASSWAIDQLYTANDYGLIPEAMKGTDFTQSINRAEFAAIGVLLYQASSGNTASVSSNVFTDISGNTYYDYILQAYQTGIVSGMGNGLFSPTAGLNRESAATMMANVYRSIYGDLPDASQSQLFADDAQIAQWAKNPVYFMSNLGVIKGVGNNYFNPLGATTREQAIVIAKLLYENL